MNDELRTQSERMDEIESRTETLQRRMRRAATTGKMRRGGGGGGGARRE